MNPRDAIFWVLTCRFIKSYLLTPDLRKIGELCQDAEHPLLDTHYKQFCKDHDAAAFRRFLDALESSIVDQTAASV